MATIGETWAAALRLATAWSAEPVSFWQYSQPQLRTPGFGMDFPHVRVIVSGMRGHARAPGRLTTTGRYMLWLDRVIGNLGNSSFSTWVVQCA